MPGRKSNISTTSVGPEDGTDSTPVRTTKEGKEGLGVEDLSLPKSMIARLAKGVLPANTQIHKDALLALHKSATVFVSYIASNSSDNAHSSGKKTIAPQDVIAALKDAEFEDFLPRLEAELKKYNDTQCDKRNTYRRKVKEEKAAAAPADGEADLAKANGVPEDTNGTTNGHTADDDDDRPAKKFKTQDGAAAPSEHDDSRQIDEDDSDLAEVAGDDPSDDELDADEFAEDDDESSVDGEQDETMEEPGDEVDGRGEMRDEALDGPDTDGE